MKHAKKLLAFVIATLLALPLFCSAAFAADDTHTVVVDENAAGYEYVLYQMFTGDIAPNPDATGDDDKFILTNIEWGSSVLPETQSKMYTMFGLEGEDACARGVAEQIAASDSSDIFHSMMLYMEKEGKTNGASLQPYKDLELGTFNGIDGYGKADIPNGYYLVRNTAVPSNDRNAHYSDYIVKVVGEDILVEPKDATTTSQKKVQDRNTSESPDYSDEQDSADYCIGDTVPYTLTAQLPLNYERYVTYGYRLMFEDDMDKGLDWDGTATIYLGPEDTDGTEVQFVKYTGNSVTIGGEEEVLRSAYDGGTVWLLDIANVYTFKDQNKPDIALNPGDTITVKYNATLNSHALIGETGNRNRQRVIFSNNPTDRNSLGATPYDMNAVFTYKVTLNKVLFDKENNKNEPLVGADFKLEKWDEATQSWIDVTQLHDGTGAMNPAKTGDSSGHVFTFSGLDDGKYRLTETATPEGYNTLPVQEFEIKAEHPAADDQPTLKNLEGTEAHDFSLAADVTNATLSAEIVNRPGVVLPASGSIGATIIQIAGAVLLAGAVTIGIMKRRARNA